MIYTSANLLPATEWSALVRPLYRLVPSPFGPGAEPRVICGRSAARHGLVPAWFQRTSGEWHRARAGRPMRPVRRCPRWSIRPGPGRHGQGAWSWPPAATCSCPGSTVPAQVPPVLHRWRAEPYIRRVSEPAHLRACASTPEMDAADHRLVLAYTRPRRPARPAEYERRWDLGTRRTLEDMPVPSEVGAYPTSADASARASSWRARSLAACSMTSVGEGFLQRSTNGGGTWNRVAEVDQVRRRGRGRLPRSRPARRCSWRPGTSRSRPRRRRASLPAGEP